MLISLSIRNIALIESLDLEFEAGLNVLTGETGAGKSILLDALGFALGRKSRRDLVRSGAGQGSVSAVFICPPGHPAREPLAEAGIETEGDELILRRVGVEGGTTRAFINDQRASADLLGRVGERLVEVHGQHDDKGLLNRQAHRGLLDAAGGLEDKASAIRAAWTLMETRRQALDDARAAIEKAGEEAEFLRHAVDELTALAPEAGEDERLDSERRLIQSSARLIEDLTKAVAEISGDGAEGLLANALSRLTHAAEKMEGEALLEPPIAALDRTIAELAEAQSGLESVLDALNFDPGRLEAVEERLFAIRGLARKHQVQPDELPDLASDFAAQLDAIDAGEERLAALDIELAEAERAYQAEAEALTAARVAAGAEIDQAVTRELAPLKMENARFHTLIEEAPPGPSGRDRVSFTASINPGLPAGPIDKIASGGELSRFLLALKVCLAAGEADRTMVFDEIDRGVGGATAAAVGRRLARLSGKTQVLVVTHSPQVAAEGAHHWKIAKSVDGGVSRTDVGLLSPDARVDEIARMLAGETLTEEARNAAKSLMQMAG